MMNKYTIEIREIFAKEIEIEAETLEKAQNRILAYYNDRYELTKNDLLKTTFSTKINDNNYQVYKEIIGKEIKKPNRKNTSKDIGEI